MILEGFSAVFDFFYYHYLFCYEQDLIDKAQTTLVGNYNLIQKINASLGESTNGDAADDALADFNQVGGVRFLLDMPILYLQNQNAHLFSHHKSFLLFIFNR